MISNMGFDIKSKNPEFSWNVTKRKRTRKTMARSMNGVAIGGNLSRPRGGDFSGSDFEKFGEAVNGESTSVKSESIPIKKRRHLLQPPPSLTWTPLGCPERGDSDAGDFSGIELLAAAASMDEFIDDAKNGKLALEHPLNLKNLDTPIGQGGLKTNESEVSLGNMTVNGANADDSCLLSNPPSVSQSPCGNPVDVTLPKVNRRHWDLNALMETWDMPYDDSISGNISNEIQIEDVKRDTSDVARDLSDKEDTETNTGNASPDQILSGGSWKDASDHSMHANALVNSSPFSKLHGPSGSLTSSENKISVAMNQGEDCSSNLSESERTTSSVIQTVSQDIDANHIPTYEKSETAMDIEFKDNKDSCSACETPGDIIQGGQSVLSSDSRIQGHVEPSEVLAGNEGNKLPNEGSSRSIALEDSCKSSVGGGQYGDLTSSTGKIGSSIAGRQDSDVSQSHNFHIGDGDGSTKYQDVYDSPYEDGELRGSFLYSWEENELDDDFVDYESDGRNGDGFDAADKHDFAAFKGGSGVSDSVQNRNSFNRQLPKGHGVKSGSVKQYLSVHFVKDDSDNNERGVKGSTTGSGTTVEGGEPMDLNIKKNDEFMKGRCLSDTRVMADARMAHMNEYESNSISGKLGSRIGGWPLLDATHGKHAFMQERRSFCFNDMCPRPERDSCPDKRMGRYRLPTRRDRDGVYHSTTWISRRQYSSCQGAEDHSYSRPRNITGASDKMCGPDFHDSRQTSIYSKGLDRPFMRSAEERVDYFGTRSRRMPSKRGAGNYRSQGQYMHCAGRDFAEHFEPLHDEVQLSHYVSSTKERSFSPVSRRSADIGLTYKRSLSKSGTGSPGTWHPHKEQKLRSRRHSRSPDFRSEARLEKTRMPFSNPSTPNFEEGYISPSRCHFSPAQRKFRWVDSVGFANNHSGYNKSPVRMFRHRTQRFDDAVGSGQMKSDECFRPTFRPRRFTFTTNRGSGYTLESNYDDGRHGDSSEMMHRGSHPNDNGYVRRIRHNVAGDFETGSLNFEDVRATKRRDVPLIDRNEKSS